MNNTLVELHNMFRRNTLKYPALLKMLAEDLGVTSDSLVALEVGFYPHNQAWIFPERDSNGDIIGLMQRFANGKKFMLKGSNSKRGLIYVPGENRRQDYNPGKHNWIRVSKSQPCPLCGKADGCLLPSVNPESPAALVCVHISAGADRPLDVGYLHILRPKENQDNVKRTPLCESSYPIVVVEGASDVAVATDLGLTAVGRPSAEGGMSFLRELLAGLEVIVIGENDSGAGVKGMESAFATLSAVCSKVTKVLPPIGIKDLRVWKNRTNLKLNEFLDYVTASGTVARDPNTFEDDVAFTIAKRWLNTYKTLDGVPTLRNYKGTWVEFNGSCYSNVESTLRGQIYDYLEGKSFYQRTAKGDVKVEPYRPSKCKISDIIDALSTWCPVDNDPPAWLVETSLPDPVDLIPFKNGILDVNEYVNGNIVMYNSTPKLFTFDAFPYNFDEDAESETWNKFIQEIFNNDPQKINLLAEWLGYNCVPDMSYEKMMLFLGRPRSGKSTILETLQAILGQRQCCATSFQSLTGQFGYEPLVGKLAALVGDAKSPKTGDANAVLEKILHITGGDAVGVNMKHLKETPLLHLKCRFTIAMNDLPAFTDHSRALEPRLNILTFDNSYVGREDRTLKARLKREAAEGKIINFALRGLKQLRENRAFTTPDSSESVIHQFREITSPMLSFLNDCCELPVGEYSPEEYFITRDQLFDIWRAWCIGQGRQHGFKESFGRWLLASCPDVKPARRRIGGTQVYTYQGIRITAEAFKTFFGG